MVKNTQGGSKHKSQARKAQFVKHVDVEPSGPHEKYAKVTKMYRNGMCQVETQDDKVSLLCHIRGKFRGKNKKHNSIVVNSIVIIGLREWESTLKNCDLISVISALSSSTIKSPLTFLNPFISLNSIKPHTTPYNPLIS